MGHRWAFTALLALALAGCPTVDLGDTPPDISSCNPPGGVPYFVDTIEPMYFKLADNTNGCARSGSCHDRAHGLTLSRTVGDDMINYKVTQGYLNCGQPKASDLLTKPISGQTGHGGGDLFAPGSPEEKAFLGWFDQ